MISAMDWHETYALASRINTSAAGAIAAAGWPPVLEARISNEPDSIVICALEAYQAIGHAVPDDLMADIMSYLNGWAQDTELWRRARLTGLVGAPEPASG